MIRDETPEPLPREWLPESPVPPAEDAAYWNERVADLLAAADPTLARYRTAAARPRWWETLAGWWRPAAAGGLAAAAGLLLSLGLGAGAGGGSAAPDPALAAVVSDGDAAALWTAVAGQGADPVLAVVALEANRTETGGGSR